MDDNKPGNVSQRELNALAGARVIHLATLRRDGSQSRAAPVWFTLSSDRAILIQTDPRSWRARRIQRGGSVIVWIGKRRGTAFIGRAEITDDSNVINQIVEDYPRKYLMARIGLHRPTSKHFEQGKRVAIKITPMYALPQGFTSQPGMPVPCTKELCESNE